MAARRALASESNRTHAGTISACVSCPPQRKGGVRKRTKTLRNSYFARAAIAQLGERQTEDLKVPGSIPGLGILFTFDAWSLLAAG